MADKRSVALSQYLTFTVDGGLFAIEIARAREVLEFKGVTKVPNTPPFMRGVLNLRGHVIPIVDLRLRFGMARTEATLHARVVILDLQVDGVATRLGVLADSVQGVIDLGDEELAPPPSIGTRVRAEFIRGVGKRDDRILMLLDIDRVLSVDELPAASTATETIKAPTADTAEEGALT
jgi:purine-binding chemotaxis protein CheW